MRVIDSQPAFWFALEDGADLFLDCNCNSSFFGYSVLIKLTPEEVAEYRNRGRSYLSWLAGQVQDTGPPGPYQKRNVKPSRADEVMAAVHAWRTAMPNTAWLDGTRWYVPTENLLAYLTDPSLIRKTPVADQTLWFITAAADGRFYGTSRTQLWVRAPDGGFQPMSSAGNTLDGLISTNGEITIVFTPEEAGQAQTVGYGHLRRVDDAWRMEMQMATGTQSIAMHWAYMTQWMEDGLPDGVPERALEGSLRSEEWRWLLGTAWSAVDETLFPDGATFTIGEYRNGYCWGEGSTADGSALRIASSVTPAGALYLLFSVAGAPAAARRGTLASTGGAYRMTWSEPSGGPTLGGAAPAG